MGHEGYIASKREYNGVVVTESAPEKRPRLAWALDNAPVLEKHLGWSSKCYMKPCSESLGTEHAKDIFSYVSISLTS